MTSTETFLVGLTVGESADRWALLGFQPVAVPQGTVGEVSPLPIDSLPFNNGALWCVGRPSPTFVVARAGISPGSSDNIDGIPVEFVPREWADHQTSLVEGDAPHPNGATSLDHIVINTDSLERTSEAVEQVLGLPLLRVRESGAGLRQVRQGFHRFSDPVSARHDDRADPRGCIIEVVQLAESSSNSVRVDLFGAVANTNRLDALAADLGEELMSAPRPAVQSGRSISTVRSAADLPIAFAFMTPETPRLASDEAVT